MDKFRFKIFEWKELQDVLVNIFALIGLIFMVSTIFSCDDKIYVAGYNKDMQEIHQQIFEVDSLLMIIEMQLDSNSVNFERFYINAQRINNGHG